MMRFLPCVAGALLTATAVEARAEKDSSHSLQAVLDPSGSLLDGPPSSSSSAAASAAQAADDRGKKTTRRHSYNHVQQEQQQPRSPKSEKSSNGQKPAAAALVRKSSISSSIRSRQKNSPKPETGTASGALQTMVRSMDAKKKSKAGALIRSSATQKKSSSRLRRGKARMMNSADDQCDLDAALTSNSSSIDATCKTACLAKMEQCYGLQPGDSFTGASATDEEMCSDACMDALDTYETACEDCVGSPLPGSTTAQSHRDSCTATHGNPTIGQHCTTEAAGGDGTSCEDACKAYYQTCYEADEDALHDDVIEDDVGDTYCTDGCYSAMDSYVAACPNGLEGPTKDSGSAKDACEFGANFAAALFYWWLYCILCFLFCICCCLGLAFIFCYSSVACLFVCCEAVNKPAADAPAA